jgi:predicted membrane protein
VYISRSVLLLILAVYVFSPTAFGWMIDPGGAWYRPYLIWAAIVLTSFALQFRRQNGDEEF